MNSSSSSSKTSPTNGETETQASFLKELTAWMMSSPTLSNIAWGSLALGSMLGVLAAVVLACLLLLSPIWWSNGFAWVLTGLVIVAAFIGFAYLVGKTINED